MTVKLNLRDETYEVRGGMTLRHALEKIGLDGSAVLATREGELITEEEILQDDEEIKLIAVISGG